MHTLYQCLIFIIFSPFDSCPCYNDGILISVSAGSQSLRKMVSCLKVTQLPPPHLMTSHPATTLSYNTSNGGTSAQLTTNFHPLPGESDLGTPIFLPHTRRPSISMDMTRTTNQTTQVAMKSIMTDVQKAIEQPGWGRGPNEDGGGARSFSFANLST